MLRPSLLPDRLLVGAAVVSTCTLVWSGAADPVNVVKLTAALCCVVLLVTVAAFRVIASRTLTLPFTVHAAAGGALLVGFLVAAVVAPHGPTAVLGTTGRNTGLLAYASGVLLYLVTLRVFDAGSTRMLAWSVLLAGLFTGLYGALQLLGVDAIRWNNPFNPVIASLGNPNFASAYLGIAAPVALWGVAHTGWPVLLRGLSAATGLLCLGVAVASEAVQGPVAAAAGLGVTALAMVLNLESTSRRVGLRAFSILAATGLMTMLLGVGKIGPAAAFFAGTSYDARTWYWSAALEMFQRNPLVGVGLDSYGLYWRQDRPLEATRVLGGDNYSNAAHNVPLQHLAQGGLLLGLAYTLFVVLVAVALVQGLRRTEGQQRLLLGGLGGAWVAYQVQSIVSIDQIALLVLNYVLAAAVVVAAGAVRLREVRLPGAAAPIKPTGQGRKAQGGSGRPVVRRRRLTPVDVGGLALVALVTGGLLWAAILPMRASTAAYEGNGAVSRGQGTSAIAAYDRALDLTPGVGVYWTYKAQTYNAGGQVQEARQAFLMAFEVDPTEVASLRNAADFAERDGDRDGADRLYRRLLRVDPANPDLLFDYTGFLLRGTGAQQAREELEGVVVDFPQHAGLWAQLGDARLVLEDLDGAADAYARALAIDPESSQANNGEDKLEAARQ